MREREQPAPVLSLTHDYLYAYRGYHDLPSQCRIRIYEHPALVPIVIATELPDNPGTSLTNLAEQLCAAVIRAHFPERFEEEQPVRWIEHYARTPDELRRNWPEFALVTFHSPAPRRVHRYGTDRLQLGTPHWTYLPRARVEQLVGQPITI